MSEPFIDTDVIIRLLTGDDVEKQIKAKALFLQVEAGRLKISAPVTVIADAVYVLSSPRLYSLPRADISELLTILVGLPNFNVSDKRSVLNALNIYSNTNVDFGDAFIAAAMLQDGSDVLYSYDKDFDRITEIRRIEP